MHWLALLASMAGIAATALITGILIGHRKTWPFSLLQRLAHQLRARRRPSADVPSPSPAGFSIRFETRAEALAIRQRLRDFIWQPGSPPAPRPLDLEPSDIGRLFGLGAAIDIRQGRLQMDHGVDSRVVVFRPRQRTREVAVIYQQGHEGPIRHGREVIAALVRAGYPVAALAMPLLGGNAQPVVELPGHGRVRLTEHDWFWFVDHAFGGSSIRFFVEPVLSALVTLQAAGARRIAMLGWSGGGWTTSLCAAIEPRIDLSFAVAGSLPFNSRTTRELSDYENHVPALYDIANYPELYALGALEPGRRATQVLNRFDTVAWHGERGRLHEASVASALTRIGGGRFDARIDAPWVGHGISRDMLTQILCELDRWDQALRNPAPATAGHT